MTELSTEEKRILVSGLIHLQNAMDDDQPEKQELMFTVKSLKAKLRG